MFTPAGQDPRQMPVLAKSTVKEPMCSEADTSSCGPASTACCTPNNVVYQYLRDATTGIPGDVGWNLYVHFYLGTVVVAWGCSVMLMLSVRCWQQRQVPCGQGRLGAVPLRSGQCAGRLRSVLGALHGGIEGGHRGSAAGWRWTDSLGTAPPKLFSSGGPFLSRDDTFTAVPAMIRSLLLLLLLLVLGRSPATAARLIALARRVRLRP